MKPSCLISLLAIVALATTGCVSRVQEGPALPPSDQPNIIRGTEPEPEPIPQKDVPTGQSSLRHNQPD